LATLNEVFLDTSFVIALSSVTAQNHTIAVNSSLNSRVKQILDLTEERRFILILCLYHNQATKLITIE